MKILQVLLIIVGGSFAATAFEGTGFEWFVAIGAAFIAATLLWKWEKS